MTGVDRSMLGAPHRFFGMRGFRVLAEEGARTRAGIGARRWGGDGRISDQVLRAMLCFACLKTFNIDIASSEYLSGSWNVPLVACGRPPCCGELSALH